MIWKSIPPQKNQIPRHPSTLTLPGEMQVRDDLHLKHLAECLGDGDMALVFEDSALPAHQGGKAFFSQGAACYTHNIWEKYQTKN